MILDISNIMLPYVIDINLKYTGNHPSWLQATSSPPPPVSCDSAVRAVVQAYAVPSESTAHVPQGAASLGPGQCCVLSSHLKTLLC